MASSKASEDSSAVDKSSEDSSRWKDKVNPKKWGRKRKDDTETDLSESEDDSLTTARPNTKKRSRSGRRRSSSRKPTTTINRSGASDSDTEDGEYFPGSGKSTEGSNATVEPNWEDTMIGTEIGPQDTADSASTKYAASTIPIDLTEPDWRSPSTTSPPTYVPNFVNDYGTSIAHTQEGDRSEIRLEVGAGETNFTADVGGVIIKFQRHGPMLQPAGSMQILQTAQSAADGTQNMLTPPSSQRPTPRPAPTPRSSPTPTPPAITPTTPSQTEPPSVQQPATPRPEPRQETTVIAPSSTVQTRSPADSSTGPQSTSTPSEIPTDTDTEADTVIEQRPKRSKRSKRSEPESRRERSRLTKKRPTPTTPFDSELETSDSDTRRSKKSRKARERPSSRPERKTRSERPSQASQRPTETGDSSKWKWLNNWKDDTDLSERDYRDKKLFVRHRANRVVSNRYGDTSSAEGREAAQLLSERLTDHCMTELPPGTDEETYAYGVRADLDQKARELGLSVKEAGESVDLYKEVRDFATNRTDLTRNLWADPERTERLGDYITRCAPTEEARSEMIDDYGRISMSLDEQTGKQWSMQDLSAAAVDIMQDPTNSQHWQDAVDRTSDRITARNTARNTTGFNPNRRR